jgi:phage/plasmid-like protein (TIGR03299 family)
MKHLWVLVAPASDNNTGGTAMHEVESAVFAGNRPAWHGLGTVLPSEALDTGEALTHSGLAGWGLTKQPIYQRTSEGGFDVIAGRHAVTRARDDRVLGVVGDTFRIVHNEEAFDWMDALLGDAHGFHYEAAGSLRGGAIVWLLAKAPFPIALPDSTVDSYVLLTNGHDGMHAVTAAVTPVRVVCMNTLRAALGSSGAKVSIRHTPSAERRLAEAQRVLGLAQGAADHLEHTAHQLLAKRVSDADVVGFLDRLVPVDGSDRARTRARNIRGEILSTYRTTDDQREIVGTAWGLFNAVVAHHDHQASGRVGRETDPAEARMSRILLRENITDRAYALLS